MMLRLSVRKAIAIVGVFALFFGLFSLVKHCRPKINLDDYPVVVDYGKLNEKQCKVLDDILTAGYAGESMVEHDITLEEFDEIMIHLGYYYGSPHNSVNLARWRKDYAILNLDMFRKLEADKASMDAQIDAALSSMYEGSVRSKLSQISKYIAKKIRYTSGIDQNNNATLQALLGKGVCREYAMLFYKMAVRLGIETYVCFGYVNNGIRTGYHSWNMVVIDGKTYFYDITWYDTPFRVRVYIHSETSWGRDFTVNSY